MKRFRVIYTAIIDAPDDMTVKGIHEGLRVSCFNGVVKHVSGISIHEIETEEVKE